MAHVCVYACPVFLLRLSCTHVSVSIASQTNRCNVFRADVCPVCTVIEYPLKETVTDVVSNSGDKGKTE